MNSTERPDRTAERSAAADPVRDRPMTTDEIRAAYADQADRLYRFDFADRLLAGRYRRRQFGDAEGRVLDVACGTGTNFPYLPASVDLVGVDVSPEMLAKAGDRLDGLALDGTLRRMDAQDLEFPDDSFDTVISALSTCTFPDPVAALREMERVCDPDGRILLVEHGRSDVGPVARFQEWREDAHYASAGCRWTQEPLAVAAEAGLSVREAETSFLGMITTIEARPE
ncbi:class I SAM-dependent methyltransferase [Halostella litorea]|uniref:class I SAM-dependent methyltransferase n=1 Tax=Halostella litorea TaxID=2528831 RepID=UPI001F3DAF58|nr:class I SAM-dependent methyltransferase [Halostella litorea]